MSNKRITDLTELTTPTTDDVFPIVDIATNTTQKVQVGNLPIQTAVTTALATKQATLVSGTNIKTVNSTTLLGSGDIAVQTPLVSGTSIKTVNSNSLLGAGDVAVQPTLVSGTNIKTLNSVSLLGSGDIVLAATPSGVSGAIQFSNGSAFASDASNFFWDNTNKRLGVGTNAPSSRLQIVTDDATNPQAFSNQTSILAGTASQGALISAFSSTNGAFLNSLWPGNAWFKMNYGGTNHNFSVAGTVTAVIDSNTTFGNGTTSLGARLGVRGSGSTSATTSLLVQNSSGLIGLIVTDDGSATSYGKGGQITNAAFGGISLSVNTSGSTNAAFGYASLNFNTTGSSNTAIGFQSGYGNATGSNNTAIGRNSNITVANYSDNTTVGAFADCGGFSGCTILGKSAVATANNQFVVGSVGTNAGAVNSTTDVPATFLWSVRINGTNYKILMTT